MDQKLRDLGYMTLDDVLQTFTPEERAEIETETQRVLAEYMSLQQMRKARKLTQVRLAKRLKVGQESISRMEQRSDLHLSTLRHYVEAMGGSLTLTVRFPDRPPIQLTGLAEPDVETGSSKKPKAASAKSRVRSAGKAA